MDVWGALWAAVAGAAVVAMIVFLLYYEPDHKPQPAGRHRVALQPKPTDQWAVAHNAPATPPTISQARIWSVEHADCDSRCGRLRAATTRLGVR